MTVTKFEHACVQISSGDRAVTIDSGHFASPESVEAAGAVLITHVHPDHYAIDNLRATDVPIFTIAEVADQIAQDAPDVRERVTGVGPGQTFDAAGFQVTAVGELHAPVHPDLPSFFNSGYLVRGAETVYHPGDSFTLPDQPVDVLLAPVSGPFVKLAEVVDFARAVKAPTTLAIHETLASDAGLALIDTRLTDLLAPYGSSYVRLQPGEELG